MDAVLFHDWRTTVMRIPLLIIAIVFLLCGRAYALETDEILQSQADALDLDGLQQAAEEYVPEFDWTQTPDLDGGLADLLKTDRVPP